MPPLTERTVRGRTLQASYTACDEVDAVTPLEQSWQDFIFAEIWSRPGLDLRARFLVALAGAASAGDADATTAYAAGAMATGALTPTELHEAALHIAVYCGWSAGTLADRAVTRAAERIAAVSCPTTAPRTAPCDPDARMANGSAQFLDVMTFDGPRPGIGLPYLQDGILNFVFGEMWCREGLDKRSRRFLTLVGVADSGATVPIASHFHAAMASGNCTAAELHEFVLHYAVHAGWPKASVIQSVVLDMARKVEGGLPWNG